MYINDVIRLARNYFPSEFSVTDMYTWCDEVSSMLISEDRYIYHEKTVNVDSEGTLLLPKGVKLEHIERIYSGSDEIEKDTLIGISKNRFKAPLVNTSVNIIYQSPYEPIRLVKYVGSALITDGRVHIAECEFLPDDSIIIQFGSDEASEAVNVSDITFAEEENKYILHIPEAVTASRTGAYDNIIITRYVTDKTVCQPPFDSMYIDYILAKINLFQRDNVAYNQHMSAFNSRLEAYKKWLMSRMPLKRMEFKNWW